jgi:hypothetical protein
MRHLARGFEEGLTSGTRLSDCHLNKHRLINSLWTKVSERSEGVCPGQCLSKLLNPQNFANTIGKPCGERVGAGGQGAGPVDDPVWPHPACQALPGRSRDRPGRRASLSRGATAPAVGGSSRRWQVAHAGGGSVGPLGHRRADTSGTDGGPALATDRGGRRSLAAGGGPLHGVAPAQPTRPLAVSRHARADGDGAASHPPRPLRSPRVHGHHRRPLQHTASHGADGLLTTPSPTCYSLSDTDAWGWSGRPARHGQRV